MDTLTSLGVSSSGALWYLKQNSSLTQMSSALSYSHLPHRLIEILLQRGIAPENFDAFLNPTLKSTTPDPMQLTDMQPALKRVVKALETKEKITIFGDYDVDGATSTASLMLFFHHLTHPCSYYIPNREKEGYGPNKEALTRLKEQGSSLVITVDCGASAHQALAHAEAIGLDIIIIDHHLIDKTIPPSVACINPNRPDDTSGLGYLAAVGVTFLFLVALRKTLREANWFKAQGFSEPPMVEFLILAALGTVCDVMPLVGFNRTLVRQGLKALETTKNIGFKALLKESGLIPPYSGHHFGFVIGPRINAAGRIDDARCGTQLLTTSNQAEAEQLSSQLSRLNQERQLIEKEIIKKALQLKEANQQSSSFICLYGEDWPTGIIGLVASRLKEKYHQPTFIISLSKNEGKGSARSIKGFDIGRCIQQAVQVGLLQSGGGHPMAGGFSIDREQLHAFQQFLAKATLNLNTTKSFEIDQVLTLEAITLKTYQELDLLEPYGPGNSRPLFLFQDCVLKYADIMGKDHLRLTLSSYGQTKPAVLFKAFDSPLGHLLLNHVGKPIDVVGTLRKNEFNNQTTLQIMVEDARIL